MSHPAAHPAEPRTRRIHDRLRRPELLACLPALTLGAYWLGGETLLILCALGLPLLIGLAMAVTAPPEHVLDLRDGATGLPTRESLLKTLDRTLSGGSSRGTACLVLTADDPDGVIDRFGHRVYNQVLRSSADRLAGALRDSDVVARLPGASFAVALAPTPRYDLEVTLQLAARLQQSLSAPLSIDGKTLLMGFSVGFCMAGRAPEPGAAAFLASAERAAEVAQRNGPGAIRAYTPDMVSPTPRTEPIDDQLAEALEKGEIQAYFQPQICTDTGEISGFEVLARWQHPERGLVPPAEFLPALIERGLSERLSEVMLVHALEALRGWEQAGLRIPNVAINLSGDELRNPKLPAKIRWELDRFELAPERLTLEILETVASEAQDDVIVQNIAALAAMGCGIDLDDFGTGHAAIATIRRYAIRRIKIDRSFVTRIDQDREQQRMISAILSMAEQLGLDTVAEGVERAGEHTMLAQLGCGHVQGYTIARPLPLAETAIWIERYHIRLAEAAKLRKRIG